MGTVLFFDPESLLELVPEQVGEGMTDVGSVGRRFDSCQACHFSSGGSNSQLSQP
jgi:hypothetical protein